MFRKICGTITLIGALGLGLWGAVSLDVVAWLCGGAGTAWARCTYVLFGLAAIGYMIAARTEKSKQMSEDGGTAG